MRGLSASGTAVLALTERLASPEPGEACRPGDVPRGGVPDSQLLLMLPLLVVPLVFTCTLKLRGDAGGLWEGDVDSLVATDGGAPYCCRTRPAKGW